MTLYDSVMCYGAILEELVFACLPLREGVLGNSKYLVPVIDHHGSSLYVNFFPPGRLACTATGLARKESPVIDTRRCDALVTITAIQGREAGKSVCSLLHRNFIVWDQAYIGWIQS